MKKKSAIPHSKSSSRIPSPTSAEFATRLHPLVLRREGYGDEIYYAAKCAKCGRYVRDLKKANVSTVGETAADLIPVGDFGGAEAFLIPSEGAYVFCMDCDDSSGAPWTCADRVFKSDQRYAFEKRVRA